MAGQSEGRVELVFVSGNSFIILELIKRFSLVSACHSRWTGEAFVACGVQHVIAVRTENELSDEAAKKFTKHFYYALFKGKTVRDVHF